MAEDIGFEPTRALRLSTVFKTVCSLSPIFHIWCVVWESNPEISGFKPVAYTNSANNTHKVDTCHVSLLIEPSCVTVATLVHQPLNQSQRGHLHYEGILCPFYGGEGGTRTLKPRGLSSVHIPILLLRHYWCAVSDSNREMSQLLRLPHIPFC